MRAIAVDRIKGEPRLMNLPQPKPKDDQLLVKVRVAGMNPFDWKLADGVMEGAMPSVLPLILGSDAAGVVSATGAMATHFVDGDRVFGQFFHAPVGEGTYAEFAVVPESGAVAKIPAGISDDVAAALPTAGMTALAMLDAMDLKAGSTVLIVGAAGGVGLFATQLAAARGVAIATAGSEDRERLRRLGASEIVDYRADDIAAQVLRAHPNGIDALIDLVSDPAGFAKMTQLVVKGGCAFTTIGSADAQDLQKRGLKGGNFFLKAKRELLNRLAAMVERKLLEVPIAAAIGLDQAPAAIAAGRRGGSRGKTVIRVSPES
jgi:NADPH:quinone reductase-like Zn-dependent oxidoreductase